MRLLTFREMGLAKPAVMSLSISHMVDLASQGVKGR